MYIILGLFKVIIYLFKTSLTMVQDHQLFFNESVNDHWVPLSLSMIFNESPMVVCFRNRNHIILGLLKVIFYFRV